MREPKLETERAKVNKSNTNFLPLKKPSFILTFMPYDLRGRQWSKYTRYTHIRTHAHVHTRAHIFKLRILSKGVK